MTDVRPRSRRWWRWVVRAVIVLVAARVLLALLLPWIVGLSAKGAGLSVTYRSASLSLHRLSLHIDDLVARDANDEGAPPLLTAQQIDADLSVWRLLHGELVLVDAAIDGAVIHVERRPDGSLRLPAAWLADSPVPTPTAPSTEPVRFDLPMRIVSARLHGVTLIVDDAQAGSVARPQLTADVDATDLGFAERPGSVSVRLHAPAWFDQAWLRAEVMAAEDHAAIGWTASLRGVRPTSLPGIHTIGVDAHGELTARRDDAQPAAMVVGGNVHVAATAGDEPLLTIDAQTGDVRPTHDGHEVPFSLSAHGDRVVGELAIRNGIFASSPARTAVDAHLECRALSLQRFASWLAELGIELPRSGVDATARLHVEAGTANGTTSLSASIDDVALSHGDERVILRHAAIRDVRAVDGSTLIDRIEINGPDLAFARRSDRRLSIGGVRIGPPAVPASRAPAGDPANTAAAANAATADWPDVRLRELDWRGIEVAFTDESLPRPAKLRVLEGSLVGTQLATRGPAEPGRLRATCMVADAIGGAHLDAELRPEADSLAANATITANDITLHDLAPWLAESGIEPAIDNGRFRAMVFAKVVRTATATIFDAAISNVQLEERGEALLSLRNLQGTGLRISPDGVHLGKWIAMDPFVRVRRGADGALRAAGLAFGSLPIAAAGQAATTTPAPTSTPTPTPSSNHLPVDATHGSTAPRPTHDGIELRGGAVRWQDTSGTAPVEVTVGAEASIGADDGTHRPVPFDVEWKVERAADSLRLRGNCRLAPASVRIDADLDGKGIRGDGLAAMLPQSLRCTLADGALHAHVHADVTSTPVTAVLLRVDALRLDDRGVEAFAVDSVVVDVPHFAPDRVHVRSVKVDGARALLASDDEGLFVPGFLLRTMPAAPAATTRRTPPSAIVVPALRIDELDVQLERLVWRDRTGAEGQPVTTAARLRLVEPWSSTNELADSPPLRLGIEGRVEPFCREWQLDAKLAPFEIRPTIDLTIRATGIDVTGLANVMPRLANDVQGLTKAGELSATLEASFDLHRRDPNVFPFGQPLGAELTLEQFHLREPDREPLASVAFASIDVRSFDPRTGDLFVRSIEVDDPRLRMERSMAGVDLFGVRLLPLPIVVPPADATRAKNPPAAAPPPAAVPPVAATPSASPAPEFAIDRVRVQGLALDFTDTTTEPPTRLPLCDGDLSVQNLSSKTLAEPRPVAFRFSASGGDVELEPRVLRDSALAELVGAATDVIGGADDVPAMEKRPLFEELRVTGQIVMHPVLKGRIHTTIRSLELPALRGFGKRGGVELEDGVYDLDVDADLRAGAGVHLTSRSIFTWLSVTEPAGGPISTYLRLPAPLDTVLFLLRDGEGQHVIPLTVELSPERTSGTDLAGAAVEALGRALAEAIAGATFRTAGALTRSVGFGTDTEPLPAARLSFAAGESALTADGLDEVVTALAGDARLDAVLTHELGGADLRRADDMATPAVAVVATSLDWLRNERASVAARRGTLANEVAALYAAGRVHDARTMHAALAPIDERLGQLERTIDETLRVLAGETARERVRRQRQAAIAMAERRLNTVKQALVDRLGAESAVRVDWRQPRAVEAKDTPDGGRVMVVVRRRAGR